MELYSSRFWIAVASYNRRVQQAAEECESCFERLSASRGTVTPEAHREFLLEYELAAAELRGAVAELRAFQRKHLRNIEARQRSESTRKSKKRPGT